MITFLLALQVLATSAVSPASIGGSPPAPGGSEWVRVVTLEGLPSDTLVRGAFMAGFRGELGCDKVSLESGAVGGSGATAKPVANRFRWRDNAPGDEAWKLEVTLAVPPPVVIPPKGDRPRRVIESRRRSRGMIAAFTVTPPASGVDRARPSSDRVAFAFPSAGSDPDAALGVSATGYVFPWDEAGRVVARLALERMLRQRGDMGPRERVALGSALRVETAP